MVSPAPIVDVFAAVDAAAQPERGDMGEVRDPRLHAVDERDRAIDLAERPRHDRQRTHRGGAGVLSKAKSQIVVAAGLEQGESPASLVFPNLVVPGRDPL